MTLEAQAQQSRDPHWFSVPHFLIFMILWATVHAVMVLTPQPELFLDRQMDPDGYMRLARVKTLLDGGGWYDGMITRSNWPYGEVHHWTRPLDVLIIALALPFRAFLDADAALGLSGVLLSPLCHLALCVASVWIVRPIVPGPERFLAMPAMLLQLGVLLYAQSGRADHHVLIFLLASLALGAWIRALLNPRDGSAAAWAGVLSGVGIWVSPESLLPLALLFVSGVAAWVLGGQPFLAPNRRLSLGLVGALAVAIALQRPPAGWLEVEFDQISLAHVTMSLLAFGFWWAMALTRGTAVGYATTPLSKKAEGEVEPGWASRFLVAAAGGLVAAGLLAWIHAGFFGSPWVDVDPRVVDVWLGHVQELRPLFPSTAEDFGRLLTHLGAVLYLLPLLSMWLWRQWHTELRPVWILLFLSLLVYVPLALFQIRFSAYAGIVFSLLMVETLRRIVRWTGAQRQDAHHRVAHVAGTAAVLIGPLSLGFIVGVATQETPGPEVSQESGADRRDCSLYEMARVLADPEGLGSTPLTIAAFIDFGPELLYRTPHRILAGPYHRNHQGILGAYRLLTSTTDHEAMALAEEREVDLILLCPPADRFYFGREGSGTLYNRLLLGGGPEWIRTVPLPPEALSGFLLFRVDRGETSAGV